jgi:hypothetical protein
MLYRDKEKLSSLCVFRAPLHRPHALHTDGVARISTWQRLWLQLRPLFAGRCSKPLGLIIPISVSKSHIGKSCVEDSCEMMCVRR